MLSDANIGAAYGIVTAVFQEGHGASAIGLDGAIPIVSYVPMMMFAILFGLAMDYQVFLLSRVREEIDAGKSPRRAVVDGLAGTGKVIASAAAIMVAVFASFIVCGDPTVKEFGVGLSAAILIAGSMVSVNRSKGSLSRKKNVSLVVMALNDCPGPSIWDVSDIVSTRISQDQPHEFRAQGADTAARTLREAEPELEKLVRSDYTALITWPNKGGGERAAYNLQRVRARWATSATAGCSSRASRVAVPYPRRHRAGSTT